MQVKLTARSACPHSTLWSVYMGKMQKISLYMYWLVLMDETHVLFSLSSWSFSLISRGNLQTRDHLADPLLIEQTLQQRSLFTNSFVMGCSWSSTRLLRLSRLQVYETIEMVFYRFWRFLLLQNRYLLCFFESKLLAVSTTTLGSNFSTSFRSAHTG